MIEKAHDVIENDRNGSLKIMEEDLNISRETMRLILHEDLGKTKITKHGAFSTTQKLSVKERNGSRKIHHKPKNHARFHQKLLTRNLF
ncbi:hypothetical protein Trydic_g4693 [Trypoxylus dichotomus]